MRGRFPRPSACEPIPSLCHHDNLSLFPSFSPRHPAVSLSLSLSIRPPGISILHGGSVCKVRTPPCSLCIMGNSMEAGTRDMGTPPCPTHLRSQSLGSFTQNDRVSHSDSVARSSSPPVPCTQAVRTNHGGRCKYCVTNCGPSASSDRAYRGFPFLRRERRFHISPKMSLSHSLMLSYMGANGEDAQLAHWESTLPGCHFLSPQAYRVGAAEGGGPRLMLYHACPGGGQFGDDTILESVPGLDSPWSLQQSGPHSPFLNLVLSRKNEDKSPKHHSPPPGSLI